MQNYYIRIEDMPSLVSHQLSIIKYVVLKKIFFFLCFDRLIWTWTWTWTLTSLDSNLFGLGLDLDSNLFGLGLVLDSTKVDLTTALTHTHTPGAVGTHTHTPGAVETHTHTHTHLEQWAVNVAASGGQLGVRCLAQGSHFSRGQFLPEPRTHNLRLQVQRSIH